ncbi:MAG: ABC transporter permease subunit [Dehalococcoidia bacterium]
MAEVRRVADRVTIFRGGSRVAVHALHEVQDEQIVEEMLGRKARRLYPERAESSERRRVVLGVQGLRDGRRLKGVDFDLREGEILGVGGLQGQGQSELLLTLYGRHASHGQIRLNGTDVDFHSPRQALRGDVGLALVPEDRQRDGLLLSKSIKDNVVLPVLRRVTSGPGIINRRDEERLAREALAPFDLSTSDLDQPAASLSGGNQQKLVIAKVLLTGARLLLMHDPTRGVDVGTKAEIFELMRILASRGYAILYYTTDLQELVNVADRVLVMNDGVIAATLVGDERTEEQVLHAILRHQHVASAASGAGRPRRSAGLAVIAQLWRATYGRSSRILPFALLAGLVALYAARQSGVLTVSELNLTMAAALPLILVGAGQAIAILSGGFDLSVGGIISLTTVIGATQFSGQGPGLIGWLVAVAVGGAVLGGFNGVVVTRLEMDPFIVTLAAWSIWGGAALLILKTSGGVVPHAMVAFGNGGFAGLQSAVWLAIALLVFWAWLSRTRTGVEITAVGSNRAAAALAGVNIHRRVAAAYALSGVFAVLAGLFLMTQTATGDPTAGNEFILTSIAAVVIGGTVLGGGRATMAGTVAAALTLTVIGNVVFTFSLPAGWQTAFAGALLILAVLANTLPGLIARRRGEDVR